MKTYREIAQMAEKAIDEMMKTPEQALQLGVTDAMEILGIVLEKTNKKETPFSVKEKITILTKMGRYIDQLIEPALHIKNEFGKPYGIWSLHVFIEIKEALTLLETMPTPTGEVTL